MRRKRTAVRADPTSVLFPQTRRRLLAWLFTHCDEVFYVRQLVEIIGGSTGDVPRELAQLAAAGIVRRTPKGRHVYFRADSHCPIFEDLRSIFTKSTLGSHGRE